MNRQDHLEWCKKNALVYVDIGDLKNAWASMTSDLGKHNETREHVAIDLGIMMIIAGHLSTTDEMRKFILGFD